MSSYPFPAGCYYIDARLYEPETRRSGRGWTCSQKEDPDFAHYNQLFDEFLHLAAHFRNKQFIPQSRVRWDGTGKKEVVEWMVPAYCAYTSAALDVADSPETLEMKQVTAFYRDRWLELDAKMDELSQCRYVHVRSCKAQAIVSGPTFEHNLTMAPVLGGESYPHSVWNSNTQQIDTRPLHVDGQGLVANKLELILDPRVALEYKRRLMSMIFENR